MAAKTSAEMKKAFQLFLMGLSVSEAAARAGVHRKSMYGYQPYKDYIAAQKAKESK